MRRRVANAPGFIRGISNQILLKWLILVYLPFTRFFFDASLNVNHRDVPKSKTRWIDRNDNEEGFGYQISSPVILIQCKIPGP